MNFAADALLVLVSVLALAIGFVLVWRSRLERIYREKAEHFRLVIDRAPLMIWTARPDSTLDYLNGTCSQFTGLSMDKLVNEGWLEAVHPDDLERILGIYVPAIEARLPFTMEYRLRHADGSWRWMLASGLPHFTPDGDLEGYAGCDVDITERRDAEDRNRESQAALELSHGEIQKLAGRLIEAQDAERARIARDLHDDVSQQLAGMSIALSGLRHRMEELELSEELKDDLRSLHERTTTLGWNIRHLSHDLHPTVLRHSGLVAALTSYCAELQRVHRTGANCHAEGDFESVPPETALSLYRIAQEAVRNVIAHAGASRVDVQLRRNDGHVELTIADDGKGFDVAGASRLATGLGLVSIAERARLAKGTVDIASGPGQGTRVRVRVPA